jgi:hypothetical protein
MRRHAPLYLVAAILVIVVMGPWAVPLLVVASLLLTGRYVGEDRILAARATAPRVRAPKVRWSRRHAAAVVSLLERAPRTLRGPPAFAA